MENYTIGDFLELIDIKTARLLYKSVKRGLAEINDAIVDEFENGNEIIKVIVQLSERIVIVNIKLTEDAEEISATPHTVNVLSMDEWLDYMLTNSKDLRIK